jgi:hypothetical protein
MCTAFFLNEWLRIGTWPFGSDLGAANGQKLHVAGGRLSVRELPMPGDCQHREQQQGNDFFGV